MIVTISFEDDSLSREEKEEAEGEEEGEDSNGHIDPDKSLVSVVSQLLVILGHSQSHGDICNKNNILVELP